MIDLTTIILTYNEELNIIDCINSVKDISKRIIIIDSYSTDKTIELAAQLGVEVYQHEFVNQAKQFAYAMESTNIKTKWIFKLDADERLTEKSAEEIVDICLKNSNNDINGIVLRFEVNFLGKKLKHGGIYPFRKLAIFKNGFGKVEDRNMDEHIVLLRGKVVELKNDSVHKDYKDLTTWINKHNKYSSREVLDYLEINSKNENFKNLDSKAKTKRFIKKNIYYKLPIGFRSYLYYFYRYYIKLGFLDGKEGKIFAFLQAYWYRFLVDAKIYENTIEISKSNDEGV